jgi:hypothetical protein
MLSLMRPRLSTSSTFTFTILAFFQVVGNGILDALVAICEMCTRPSLPGRILTKAPKSTMRATLPS